MRCIQYRNTRMPRVNNDINTNTLISQHTTFSLQQFTRGHFFHANLMLLTNKAFFALVYAIVFTTLTFVFVVHQGNIFKLSGHFCSRFIVLISPISYSRHSTSSTQEVHIVSCILRSTVGLYLSSRHQSP